LSAVRHNQTTTTEKLLLMLTPTGLVTALHIAISQLFSSTFVDADSWSGGPCAKRISNVCFRSPFCTRRQPRHWSWLHMQTAKSLFMSKKAGCMAQW